MDNNTYENILYSTQIYAEELTAIFEFDKRRFIKLLNEEDELE